MLKELLKCSILTSVILTGCSTVPKEDNSSVLMEDVIVERTTVRSTSQNPKPKSNGGVHISGDNINIGTIIVNSPNAKVDNSTTTNTNIVAQSQQQNNGRRENITDYGDGFRVINSEQPNYHTDRDFFKGIDSVFMKLIPSALMGTVQNQR
jgi:hypothetical protein